MPGAAPVTTARKDRLLYADRLRVVAICCIFAYHAARPFDDFEPWHIKHDPVSGWFTYPMAVGAQFAMPLFWVLSGIATWTALARHRPGEFLRRRLVRLLVPLVTVGWFLLCPPQVYIEATTDQNYLAPAFEGTFDEFLPAYVSGGLYGAGGWFPLTGLHLWYLWYLALFTASLMPLWVWLHDGGGRRLVDRLASLSGRWWLLPALGLPLLAPELLLSESFPFLGRYLGGWRIGTYWLLLLLGSVLGADPRFVAGAVRHRRLWFALAGVTTVPLLAWAPTMTGLPPYTPVHALEWGLRTANGWLFVLALIGYAGHISRPPGRLLVASASLALPFYVVHQTPIVLAAWAVGSWRLPVAVAFPLVLVPAFLVTVAACLLIRRVRALRFLFGLRPGPVALSR